MRTVTGTNQRTEGPVGLVVGLDRRAAMRIELTGAKAAALAQAARAGLPVLPGRVVTTAASVLASPHAELEAELHAAWSAMSDDGAGPVVVRSSSVLEDGRASSMAGMFTSVLDVLGWEAFRVAVDTVVESAAIVGAGDASSVPAPRAPMAVLIQPQLDSAVGGVMFGVDPVSGRGDRMVISASEAGPAAVVGGDVDGSRYVVAGRRLISQPDDGGPLSHSQVRHLARIARHAERVFGGPQDIEWAVDTDGRMWLLQSRPVTATGATSRATGPLLGPGPIAETFPDALSPLEEDLWLVPLRAGLRAALGVVGTTPRRRLAASPVVVSISGRLAADLDLLGSPATKVSVAHRFDPRPPVRRLAAAWRVGRLRAALPALAADLVSTADRDLLAVSRLSELSDGRLIGLLRRSQQGLVALQGYEVLIGSLMPGASSTTAASAALRTLVTARQAGQGDDEVIARHPGVLALTAPRVGPPAVLPPADTDFAMPYLDTGELSPSHDAAVMREALRLRARWVQELMARAAWELAGRLQARGVVAHREIVRLMSLDELAAVVETGLAGAEVTARRAAPSVPPLPAVFRLHDDGAVVAVASPTPQPGTGDGTGAAPGRGMGKVHSGEGVPGPGYVLVVRTLDPGLASVLPRLSGLVAETGSVLSHLAILAREFGIPTVVGVQDALLRFPPGSEVVVDGTVGTVTILAGDSATKAPA